MTDLTINPMDSQKVSEALSLAFSKMTIKRPFFGAVAAPMEKVLLDDPSDPLFAAIPTAGVDGVKMYFNVLYCLNLSFDQLYGLARHETGHQALGHSFRRNGRDPVVWNIACDAVINYDIRADGDALPDGGVYFDWVDETLSAEEVYVKLLTENKDDLDDFLQQCGAGSDGEDDDEGAPQGKGKGLPRDVLDAPAEASEAEVSARVASAARMAKLAGEGGATLDRVIGGALEPRVRWQDVLRSFMHSATERADYTFKRPNRRFVSSNIYMPSLFSEAMGRLVIGVDTSGSIGPEILDQVAGELSSIVADCRPSRVDVVYCDYVVSSVESFTPDEPVKLHPKGGGGTRFKPVFDWVEANTDEPPVALIYFTDTYGSFSELVDPGYPVLWGLTERVPHFTPPFGNSVEVY